ncbi:MAG: M3 family oligoendopeptidase [Bacillota bacterium]
MSHKTFSQTWDLDSIYPGGSSSGALKQELASLEKEIPALQARAAQLGAPQSPEAVTGWSSLLTAMMDLASRLRQTGAYINCLNSQNMKDAEARVLGGRHRQIAASFAQLSTVIDAQLLAIPAPAWDALLAMEQFREVRFNLAEKRRRAAEKLPPEQEALSASLSANGYHGWNEMYNAIVGQMSVPWEKDGKEVALSMSQAANLLSDADRAVRQEMAARYGKAWSDNADLFATVLNNLGGFRLNLYQARGWDSVLHEPLDMNRMTAQTLDTMWDVIVKNRPVLVEYLKRKAELLGLERLNWYDMGAPLGSVERKVTYEEAAAFIITHFGKFSPELAAFAEHAFEARWIEAKDRPGKRPGGFCTSFPLAKQSRIFMTFAGNPRNVSTLAHELGHAYHQSVMNDLPQMAQGYAMNVAETASTFAEMIVADAAVQAAASEEERLALLDGKARQAVAYLMSLHARFTFELAFYAERKRGPVSAQRLSALMHEAMETAHGGAMGEYSAHAWAGTLHYYLTGVPFYNFPYTFGYLFSAGIYARAQAEGPGFVAKYNALLRDTGRMQVEDLARQHLGVDLTGPEFWQSALNVVLADVHRFLKLTEKTT